MNGEASRLTGCRRCGQVQRSAIPPRGHDAYCGVCGARLILNPTDCLNRVLALVIAGLILYVPSNVYPVFRQTLHGTIEDTTIWSGMVDLFNAGDWPIAVVVLFASICVPLTKLLGLLFLVLTWKSNRGRLPRTRLYRIIAKIGKWSMLDVFVASITVAVIKFGEISTAVPGPGVTAFAAVVVVTLCASITFDPRVIWASAGDK